MSGGSWDYLSGQDDLPKSHVMLAASARLTELGDAESAHAAMELAITLKSAEDAWENSKNLRSALHDMEWVDSGDYLPEDFTEHMTERRS